MKKINQITLGMLLTFHLGTANANNISIPQGYISGSVLSDQVHYAIGGGSAIMPAHSQQKPMPYGLGVSWKSNLTCGDFNMKVSVKNQLNGITEGFKDLLDNLVRSATQAIANLPALILQRTNPQLYDILTNGMYQGKIDFNNFKTSCEALSSELADYAFDSKWAKMAGLERAKEIAETETDAMMAKKKIEKGKKGESGTPWIGGEKLGGKGQKPIKLIQSVVVAGYNMALGRGATEKGSVAKCDGMLCSEWKTPEEAAEYARTLLGEQTLTTCSNCGTSSGVQAGRGIAPEIEKRTIEKANLLQEVINSEYITADQLDILSTSTVSVTRGLIESLRGNPDAPILAARLAQELAISKELERALLVRRMLLTGMREPNVAMNTPAQESLEKSLKLLDREIEQVKLEMDLQRSLNNNTALMIVQSRANERDIDSNASDNVNVRLANVTKEAGKNDTDRSEGGVSAFTQRDLSDGKIIIPKPEGTGIGDIFGKFNAPDEGVMGTSTASSASSTSSSGTSKYPKLSAHTGNTVEQAKNMLRQLEGFIGYAKWDENAERLGYGSDTITRADGTVVKVKKGMTVTKEDAERDLDRRTKIYINQTRREMTPQVWDKLPPSAQATLVSMAYNYGSFSKLKSIKEAAAEVARTGDVSTLATAIRNRQVDNKGMNQRRRNQEADYILNSKN